MKLGISLSCPALVYAQKMPPMMKKQQQRPVSRFVTGDTSPRPMPVRQ